MQCKLYFRQLSTITGSNMPAEHCRLEYTEQYTGIQFLEVFQVSLVFRLHERVNQSFLLTVDTRGFLNHITAKSLGH